MISITLTCDKCGKKVTGDDQHTLNNELGLVTIVAGVNRYSGYKAEVVGKSVQYCKECAIRVGFIKDETGTVEPALTVEDVIRELVREEIRNQ